MPQVVPQGYDIFGGLILGTPFVKGFQRRFDAITANNSARQDAVGDIIANNSSPPSRDLGGFGPPGGSPSGGPPLGSGGSTPAPSTSGLAPPPSIQAQAPSSAGPGGSLSAPPSRGPGGGSTGASGGTSITGGRRGGGGVSPNKAIRGGGSLLNSR